MKITLVCLFLGEVNNGTTLVAYNLMNALKEKGHEVRIVCCDEDKRGVPGFYICKKMTLGPIANATLKRNNVRPASLSMKVLDEACKDADYVHTFSPLFSTNRALKYCLKHNIPFGSGFHCQAENFTAHVGVMNCPFINSIVYRIFFLKIYNRCDVIHYPTQFIKDYVHKYDKHNIKSYVISNGVDTDAFYPLEVEKEDIYKNKFLIIMSGRICREKNQVGLLKAINYSKYKDNIYVRFCGKGPDEKKILKKMEKHNILGDIKSYHHSDLNNILRQADLYIHSSEVEIEALSALEAMACGVVPVICNSPRSATSKFALSNNNIYECKNYKQLAERIDYWYEHPEEKKTYEEKYTNYVKQFNLKDCMDKTVNMIEEIVENYGKEK